MTTNYNITFVKIKFVLYSSLAALLSKFRIDYSDLIIIPDITKKARPETVKEFEEMIKKFRCEPREEGKMILIQ